MNSDLIWFNVFRDLHIAHQRRKNNIKTNFIKQFANV